LPSDPTLLGTVQDVKGATISVSLDATTLSGLAFIKGHGYRIGQVGSFVRIPMGYLDLFGIVSQVGAGAIPERIAHLETQGYRWMTVQLVGEGDRAGSFSRGVSQYPTVGDQVHLVTDDDLGRIYGRPDSPNFVRVGHLASAESIPALVDITKLVTRHSAVVGATGAGKSTTVANLLVSLSDLEKYRSSRIIVLDIHGEYSTALVGRAASFRINPAAPHEVPLRIPYWAMNFDELVQVVFGSLEDASRGAVLERITSLKLEALKKHSRDGVTEHNLTVDTPVPFSIHKCWFDLHRLVNATHTAPPGAGQSESTEALLTDNAGKPVQEGDAMQVVAPKYKTQSQATGATKIYLSGSTLNIRRPLESFASKLRDPRFDFLFRPGQWLPNEEGIPESDLDLLLEGWIGGPQPITILDLSGIPISVLNTLVGVLLRIIYDALFWARQLPEGGRERPLLIVLEEAHSYLGEDQTGNAAAAVRRIVKEGRKYGIGAMVVSQRPAEVDPTVLSQCGTTFAMRLTNTVDRNQVLGSVSDNLEGLLSMLPVLRTGEAIIVGEAVHLPVRTLLDPPNKNRRPDSSDPLVYNDEGPGGWNRGKEKGDYSDVVTVWRKQDPRSPRVKPKEGGGHLNRVPVVSSNVASAGYDAASSVLEVEFSNGHVYQYFDVPQIVYEQLIQAPSVGQYFNVNIKGVYRYARL
jgi:Helicase HerA, central domain/KTSC domain